MVRTTNYKAEKKPFQYFVMLLKESAVG